MIHAVRRISLEVRAGELVGLLGPNGAGKTTMMRMFTTLLRPTSGHALVGGCDLLKDPMGVRRRIGYTAQGSSTSKENTVAEELIMQARLHGVSKREGMRRADDLIDQFELDGLGGRLAKSLSGGQLRRLDLALALIHRPRVLFLDEPTTGLDPQSRANLWGHVQMLRAESGTAVFLTTHYLEEADTLAERIFIMDSGVVVAEGRPDTLKAGVAIGESVCVTVPAGSLATAAIIAAGVRDSFDISVSDRTVRFHAPRADAAVPELLRALDEAGIPVVSLELKKPTLDDVFLSLTGRSLRDDRNAS